MTSARLRDEPSTLSPKTLMAWLSPRLGLDDELVDGHRLHDCYRLSAAEPVRVELRRGRSRLELVVSPTDTLEPRPAVEVGGLAIHYRTPTQDGGFEPARALAACRRLADALGAGLGEGPRRWQVAPPSLAELADPIAAEMTTEPTTIATDPDAALLCDEFANYRRLYGVAPEPVRVVVGARANAGVSVHYPAPRHGAVANAASLYPTELRIAHRRTMRRYFAQLGFAFDVHAYLRTVPTPKCLDDALAGRAGLAPVRPRLLSRRRASIRPIPWGLWVGRGVLPVTVAPRWAVAFHAHAPRFAPLAAIPCYVGMLPHDMGLHAAAIHAIPAAAWEELIATAVARLRARPHRLLAGPLGPLARLAGFFEGALTRRCWWAWRDADEPDDFERVFVEQHLPALLDELGRL